MKKMKGIVEAIHEKLGRVCGEGSGKGRRCAGGEKGRVCELRGREIK